MDAFVKRENFLGWFATSASENTNIGLIVWRVSCVPSFF
jgi:hypothetical protein